MKISQEHLAPGGRSKPQEEKVIRHSVIQDHLYLEDHLLTHKQTVLPASDCKEDSAQSSKRVFLKYQTVIYLGQVSKRGLLTKAERRKDYICVQAHCVSN